MHQMSTDQISITLMARRKMREAEKWQKRVGKQEKVNTAECQQRAKEKIE